MKNNIENIQKIVMNVMINVKMDNFNTMTMITSVQMKNLARMVKLNLITLHNYYLEMN